MMTCSRLPILCFLLTLPAFGRAPDRVKLSFDGVDPGPSGQELLLVPGAGSELYRGLAAVIIGGMCVSAAFTLLLLPSLLRIGEGASRPAEERAGEPVTA